MKTGHVVVAGLALVVAGGVAYVFHRRSLPPGERAEVLDVVQVRSGSELRSIKVLAVDKDTLTGPLFAGASSPLGEVLTVPRTAVTEILSSPRLLP